MDIIEFIKCEILRYLIVSTFLNIWISCGLENEEDDDQPAQAVGASAAVSVENETEAAQTQPVIESQVTEETDSPSEAAGDPPPNMPCPPSYSVATNLPSYEEAERTKQEEEARRQREEETQEATSQESSVFSRMLGWQSRAPQSDTEGQLGTDSMFLCTFLLAFVFNWVGLLASMCVTQTIAGRLGAMSGFGLSLVKWVAIFKHSYGTEITTGDSWLWWLFMVMGFLIFFRGCTQYVRIKYYWHRLDQNVRNNIFSYF